MEFILLICFFLSFIITLLVLPIWIKNAIKMNLVGKDVHKLNEKKVAELGGVPVLLGFLFGVFTYVAIQTFYFNNYTKNMELMAIIASILIAAFIGLIDDIL